MDHWKSFDEWVKTFTRSNLYYDVLVSFNVTKIMPCYGEDEDASPRINSFQPEGEQRRSCQCDFPTFNHPIVNPSNHSTL